jgi:hypothetical protein
MAAANTYFETKDGPGFVGPEYVSRSGDDVTILNQPGAANFPAEGSIVTVVPGSYGFQEQDQDTFQDWNTIWAGTTLARMNYYLLMPDDTNTITATAGIPAFESIGADTLPASLYRSSVPDFFTGTGLSWPPIDPLSPTSSEQAIPAGIRYVNNVVAPPEFTPVSGSATYSVSISGPTSGASYYYTTDGSTPTVSSTLYTSPIVISADPTTIKVIGAASELSNSVVVTGTFTSAPAPSNSGLHFSTRKLIRRR